MPRGGLRESNPGGRPSTGRKKFNIYVTPEEMKSIKNHIEKLRIHEKQVDELKKLATNTAKIADEITQPLMRMECGKVQAWKEGCPDKPKIGTTTWCVWCSKVEKIKAVL